MPTPTHQQESDRADGHLRGWQGLTGHRSRNRPPKTLTPARPATNASGYGLTLGVHTRIDETIAQVTGSAKVVQNINHESEIQS